MRFVVPLMALLFSAGPAFAGDRTVTDDAGRQVVVPDRPQRIVVMHEPLLGVPLIELGVPVVGSYGRNDDGSFVTATDFIDVVLGEGHAKPKGIGPVGQIDLEKLRALAPDLIVGSELDIGKVPQLETVAPVYLQNAGKGRAYGFDVEEKLAGLVGRQEAFEALRTAYSRRLADVRAALPSDPAGQTYLAVFLTDQINVVWDMSGAVQALEDIGYVRLKLDGDGSGSTLGSTLMVPVSAETFGQLDPDLLVVMNSYAGTTRGETETRAALDRIVPGWDRFVRAAREERLVFVDSAKVTTPTVASAMHMLDALEAWSNR